MVLVRNDMFTNTSPDDVFTIKDHMVYRNGKQIPFMPHAKRKGRGTINVKFFTYHHSAGQMDLNNLVTYMANATTKADVQLCMGPNGELVQMAPLNEKCWHMGDSSYAGHHGLNQYATGIEVVNPGQLDITAPGKYVAWFGKRYTKEDGIVESKHQIHGGSVKGWYPYHENQIKVLKNLALVINRYYGAEIIGHDETTSRKTDPGPISRIGEIRAFIKERNLPPPPPPPISTDMVPEKEEVKKKESETISLTPEPIPTLPDPVHDKSWNSTWDALFRFLFRKKK